MLFFSFVVDFLLFFVFFAFFLFFSPRRRRRNFTTTNNNNKNTDTSSHTLAYTLALLAAHPRAAAKVEAELASAGLLATESRPNPRRLEFADVSRSRLPFLNAVLLESMRLLPVAAGGTARTAGEGGFELTVPEWEGREEERSENRKTRAVRVPAGVDVWVPFYVLHREKAVWGDDAEEFVPERFLDPAAPFFFGDGGEAPAAKAGGGGDNNNDDDDDAGAATSGEAPRRFLPFSHGARDCVGQALAKTALIAELAALLGRFSFEVDRAKMGGSLLPEKEEVVKGGQKGVGSTVIAGEAMAVTLRVPGGVWLLATPRGAKREVGAGERES